MPRTSTPRSTSTRRTRCCAPSPCTMDPDASPALQALYRQVQADLALLAYAQRDWVLPVTGPAGDHVHDVVIVGGGQAGLGTALALKRDGVTNVLVLDARAQGQEGVWEDFARMSHLRTPRETVGIEGGIPSLSAPAFYRAAYGEAAWQGITRIERTRWMDFLRWFRHAAGLAVRNDTRVLGLAPQGDLVAVHVATAGATQVLLARHVVLATGFDGCGAWHVPAGIAQAVAPGRIDHSSDAIDFEALRGKRVGILGHGAAAFDNACVLLRHG
ncbi:MAG: NAD(P)/FAD-dependent oxidoreductase, partial [Comamonadaceae bacterium]